MGCGWLGLPLAEALLAAGFEVKGSTTSPEKKKVIENKNIHPYLIELTADGPKGEVADFFSSDVLFVNIPPGLRSGAGEDFTAKINTLLESFQLTPPEWLIFVSSTSVFGENQGEVNEQTEPQPETESGRQLLACEKRILQLKSIKTTVLRLGGLVGGDRHPVKYLSGRKNLPDGDAFINYIHREDVIRLVLHIIEKRIEGIVHGVAPKHPKKRDYYTRVASELGILAPEYTENTAKLDYKKVVSTQLCGTFEFTFGVKLD